MSHPVTIDAARLRWEFAPGTMAPDDVATLLGPHGLRLQEWLASGQASIVKHAPHRTVYRVVLPGLDFHLKHYRGDRHEWLRALLRPSKGRAEYTITREVARRGVPTLEALACGEHANRRTGGSLDSFVITRTLGGAVSLVDYFEQVLPTLPPAEQTRVRQRLAVVLGTFLARKHRAGLRHDDLHPLNLLVRVGPARPLEAEGPSQRYKEGEIELYLIDLHGVRLGRPLSWQSSLDNLVILNRWFLIRSHRSDRRRAWRAYYTERGDLALEERPLARFVEKETRKSFVSFARTLDRRCLGGNRRFRKLCPCGAHGYAVADIDDAVLEPLMAAPDEPFDRPDPADGVRVLKKSASSAVVEMNLCVAGVTRPVIFKRFSVTAWSDPLAALVRPTAAMRSWILGHGLRFRGLPTPRPLALWHRHRLGLPAEAYLLMEKVPDARDLASTVRSLDALPSAERQARLRWLIRDVASLVRMMHERKVSHRDLKAPNLLVSPADWTLGYRGVSEVESAAVPGHERAWLVDLAGVRRHDKLERSRKVQNLARLNVSFIATGSLTRADRLRFLRDYLGFGLFGREGWKRWWKEVEQATRAKVQRNRKVGRVLG
jgi:tRNA A-37 threonylcarbamoyl transferase component Bud32